MRKDIETDGSAETNRQIWQYVKSEHLRVVQTGDQSEAVKPLFRKEVLLYQSRRLQGEVLIGTGMSWLILGYASVAVLAASLLFVSLLSYARTETVTGWLVPRGGIIRLAADQGGVVEQIYVSEGRTVTGGEPLLRLRLSRQTSEGDTGKVLEGDVMGQLQAARATAAANISNIVVTQEALIQQKTLLLAQENQGRALLTLLQKKQRLAQARAGRLQALKALNALSAQAVDDAASSVLDASQTIINQRNALLSLKQSENDLDAKLAQIPIQLDQARANAKAANEATQQQLEQVRAGSAYTINAPSAGVVMAIPCVQGQSLVPGSTVALMRPLKAPLEAELFVPSRAAGFISVGQEVSIQYQPYPYETFGSAKARIISISRAPLNPTEVATFGFNVGEPVFRVRAVLDNSYVTAYGVNKRLEAGTLLTAMIIVERRTLLEWLFDPILAVARR